MTPGLLIIKEANQSLMHLLKHSDGYPEGFGAALAEFLYQVKLVNGLSLDSKPKNQIVCNGSSCMAAQLVCAFKHGPGGVYLEANAKDYTGWKYTVLANGLEPLNIKVALGRRIHFAGDVDRFKIFCNNPS